MGRIQNIRNRSKITNERVLRLISGCVDKVQELGFTLPRELRFLQCNAKRRAGLACYRDKTIVLSTFIYKEEDVAIKSVIFHELGHIIAGPGCGHGGVWLRIVNKISIATAIKITRCYSDSDMPVHAAQIKTNGYKYNFRCKGCGSELHYHKQSIFVRTYNEILSFSKKPRWTCSKCGGTFEKI